MAVLDADWKLILAYDDDAGTTNGDGDDGETEDVESDRMRLLPRDVFAVVSIFTRRMMC